MAQLTIDNLSLGYDGNVIARDISFFVERGDYLSIIGDNGAGKSTLLRTILGLHKQLSGTISLGEGLMRTDIGYLPQAREVQKDFPASVYEIVVSGCLNKCRLRPFYRKSEQKLAYENMEKLGIAHLAGRCYRELSGGQQQRVLLARALCASKKLLVLDEPATGLDPDAASDLYDIILSLNTVDSVSIIMVSHDMVAARKYSTHILKIDNGNAILTKNPERCEVASEDLGCKEGRGSNVLSEGMAATTKNREVTIRKNPERCEVASETGDGEASE